MYCKNCGEEIDDRAVVCIKCGVPTEIHPVNDEFSEISIAAIICAFFVPLAGFILGLIGMQNAKNQKSKSLAMAGMIVGLVIMLIILLVIIFEFTLLLKLMETIPTQPTALLFV